MWASERARNLAIRGMLASLHGLRDAWDEDGPTEVGFECLAHPGRLSSVEQVILKAAFDLWNGSGHCTIDELVSTLDADRLRAVVYAMMARDEGEPR